LQRELDSLKQHLSQGRAGASPLHEEPQTVPAGSWQEPDTSMLPLQTASIRQSDAYSTFSGTTDSSEDEPRFSAAGLPLGDHISPRHSSTAPRLLDGREYDAQRIDDCFDL